MAEPDSLLEQLRRAIERTYRLDTGIGSAASFVIGDRGFELAYGGERLCEDVGAAAESEARLLLRPQAGGIRAAIYYPDALIARLEQRNPLAGLDEANIDDFAVFVEELDHLLTVADRVRRRRPVSLFDLELHANVTKYYVAKQFVVRLSGTPRLAAGDRRWLFHHLLEKVEYVAKAAPVEARYREANRLALQYLRALERIQGEGRLDELRRFHDRPAAVALARIMGH